MNKSDIVTLVHFNFWANARILSACERISAGDFTRQQIPDPGWGSLRGILVHTLDTEYGWRCVLQAQAAQEILEADDFDDAAALKSRWEAERAAWMDYLDQLSDERLNRMYGDQHPAGLLNGPMVWQTILHVVAHGIQHRSEAAAILTGCGQPPGELDFDLFLQENPGF